MRWRFTDRVERFEPWRAIETRKAVSLEEYSLLERFGREGAFPESLVLECCVEAARWLVAASSGFDQAGVLEAVESFAFSGPAGMGDALEIKVALAGPAGQPPLQLDCRVTAAGRTVAAGRIAVGLVPLAEGFDRDWVGGLWRELYAAP